ncbi:hypothetical protein TNCV_2983951 [Trichonephila clavipes]|nr:hypothetical protein TNCV_2983951 [Trichonephila clavipes]
MFLATRNLELCAKTGIRIFNTCPSQGHRTHSGCGNLGIRSMVKNLDRGWFFMSSSPVPLRTRGVEERCTLKLSRAQTSSRWCGVVVSQVRCRHRQLTMDQINEVRRQKPSCC